MLATTQPTGSLVRFNRVAMIKFYDELITGRGSDVAAITGLLGEDLLLGLFSHYWTNVEGGKSELLPDSCTPGTVRGQRLDGWLLCRKGKRQFLYQTEIKNWSAYSWGESPLAVTASKPEIAQYARESWDYYFTSAGITHDRVAKVLRPMKKPERFKHLPQIPLCCFWMYISKRAGVAFNRHYFSGGGQVHVFSASAYLRNLTARHIELKMPRYSRRLGLLKSLL